MATTRGGPARGAEKVGAREEALAEKVGAREEALAEKVGAREEALAEKVGAREEALAWAAGPALVSPRSPRHAAHHRPTALNHPPLIPHDGSNRFIPFVIPEAYRRSLTFGLDAA
jgi:hypothetical protein